MNAQEAAEIKRRLVALQNRLPCKYAVELMEIIALMRDDEHDENSEQEVQP